MSGVYFGRLYIVGREKPLLLEESVKNLAAYADLQDVDFDDTYEANATDWSLGSGVTLSATGTSHIGDTAYYDDGVSKYDEGFVYG